MSADRDARRILLLDANSNDRHLAARMLVSGLTDCAIEPVTDADSLSRHLTDRDFDLLVADSRLPWMGNDRLFERLAERSPAIPAIVLTGADDDGAVSDYLERGAFCVLSKDSAGYLQLPAMAARALSRAPVQEAASNKLVERLPVGVFSMDREGRIVQANMGAATTLGVAGPEDARGMALVDLVDSHPLQRRLQAMLEGDCDGVDMEARLRRPDGENWWARLRIWPSEDGPGSFEGTLENISDYKKTETELASQAAELGRSNSELEQFAYVVSHDLQEPLSLIQRYAEMLAGQKAVAGDKESRKQAEHVLGSSRRMQDMIDAILEYSRVETRGTPFEETDFEEVLKAAEANLAAVIESSHAEIIHDNLPTLSADRGQMLQLFQNLIGNALKFRAPKRAPRIIITATEQREHWRLTVHDNGIGIVPDARERIFGMFQRLHTGEEFPGTGIGLAICRSIVKRHGGEIWVDSVPGEGSTFHFTISRTPRP